MTSHSEALIRMLEEGKEASSLFMEGVVREVAVGRRRRNQRSWDHLVRAKDCSRFPQRVLDSCEHRIMDISRPRETAL